MGGVLSGGISFVPIPYYILHNSIQCVQYIYFHSILFLELVDKKSEYFHLKYFVGKCTDRHQSHCQLNLSFFGIFLVLFHTQCNYSSSEQLLHFFGTTISLYITSTHKNNSDLLECLIQCELKTCLDFVCKIEFGHSYRKRKEEQEEER